MIAYLNEEEVRAALNWSDLIVAMERALTAFSSGAVSERKLPPPISGPARYLMRFGRRSGG